MSQRDVLFLYHIPKTAGQSVRHALADRLQLHEGFIQVGPFGDKRSRLAGIPTFGERTPQELSAARVVAGHYLSASMRTKFPGANIASAIVLRDPAARLVSQYNHAMFTRTQKCGLALLEFEEWYLRDAAATFPWERLAGSPLRPEQVVESLVSVGHDYMAKFVVHAHGDRSYASSDADTLLEQAATILEGFEHVGAVESIDRTREFLSRFLGSRIDIRPRNVGGGKRPRFLHLTDRIRAWIEERNRVDYTLYSRFAGRAAGSPDQS